MQSEIDKSNSIWLVLTAVADLIVYGVIALICVIWYLLTS